MIPQIAYTNSNCADVWEMFVKQNRKHTNLPLWMVVDNILVSLDIDKYIGYSNSDSYYKVWIRAVEGTEYFIYLQEDFILYNDVNEEKILEYVGFLENNPQYSFVRLLRATSLKRKELIPTLCEIESSNVNVFSMQPTIWRTSDYVKIMNEVKEKRWFVEKPYRKAMMRLGIKGAYHYDGERRIGKHHYDSNVYPYIATALVKGKWNISEYANELLPLIQEYGIDIRERGVL